MVCRSVLLLFFLSSKLGTGWTQFQDLDACTHAYHRQPSAASLNNCNPTGSTVTIACSVSSSANNFRIQWHRVSEFQDVARFRVTQGVLILKPRFSVRVMTRADTLILSRLVIRNLQEEDFGYYWCTVRLKAFDFTSLPNPSRAILVSDPCNGTAPRCSPSLNLWESTGISRCANAIRVQITIDSPECNISPTPSFTQLSLPLPQTTQQPLPLLTTTTYTISSRCAHNIPECTEQDEVSSTMPQYSAVRSHSPAPTGNLPHPSHTPSSIAHTGTLSFTDMITASTGNLPRPSHTPSSIAHTGTLSFTDMITASTGNLPRPSHMHTSVTHTGTFFTHKTSVHSGNIFHHSHTSSLSTAQTGYLPHPSHHSTNFVRTGNHSHTSTPATQIAYLSHPSQHTGSSSHSRTVPVSASNLSHPPMMFAAIVVAVTVIVLVGLGMGLVVLLVILYRRRTGKRHRTATLSEGNLFPVPEISPSPLLLRRAGSVEGEYVDADSGDIDSEDVGTESTAPHNYQSLIPTAMDYIGIYSTTTIEVPRVMEGESEYCIIDKSRIDPPNHYEQLHPNRRGTRKYTASFSQ